VNAKSVFATQATAGNRLVATPGLSAANLPAGSRARAPRPFVSIHHKWVLHRKLAIRLGVALFCALALATAFQARGGIVLGIKGVSAVVSSGLALGGLGIEAIDISGQAITSEGLILTALGIDDHVSILSFNVDAARTRLLELPAVEEVTIRKIYPNRLAVGVVEKVPFARWRDGEAGYLIDVGGARLGLVDGGYTDLPLVIGAGAGDDALIMVRALDQFEMLRSGLVAISRVADRRWDLLYDTGLRVQLPEVGIRHALAKLQDYQNNHRLLDRDLSLIDLRVEGTLVVRLTPHNADAAS